MCGTVYAPLFGALWLDPADLRRIRKLERGWGWGWGGKCGPNTKDMSGPGAKHVSEGGGGECMGMGMHMSFCVKTIFSLGSWLPPQACAFAFVSHSRCCRRSFCWYVNVDQSSGCYFPFISKTPNHGNFQRDRMRWNWLKWSESNIWANFGEQVIQSETKRKSWIRFYFRIRFQDERSPTLRKVIQVIWGKL